MAAAPTLLGIRAYARHRTERFEPTSHVAVLKAMRDRIKAAIVESGGKRLIDAAKADALWLANTDPMLQATPANGAVSSAFADERAGQMRWKRRRERFEYLRDRGHYVKVEEVRSATFELQRRQRKRFFELADRLCDKLAAESNPARVRKILLDELHAIAGRDADEARSREVPRPARKRVRKPRPAAPKPPQEAGTHAVP